jgi:hypothetical protein
MGHSDSISTQIRAEVHAEIWEKVRENKAKWYWTDHTIDLNGCYSINIRVGFDAGPGHPGTYQAEPVPAYCHVLSIVNKANEDEMLPFLQKHWPEWVSALEDDIRTGGI